MRKLFDPQVRNVDLSTKDAVRVWRQRLRIYLLDERGCICDCCGKIITGGVAVHEGLVTRAQVPGWPFPKRGLIFSELNCILLDNQHHLAHPPSRQQVWVWQSERYGEEVLKTWYLGLFEKVTPERLW